MVPEASRKSSFFNILINLGGVMSMFLTLHLSTEHIGLLVMSSLAYYMTLEMTSASEDFLGRTKKLLCHPKTEEEKPPKLYIGAISNPLEIRRLELLAMSHQC